MQASLNRLAVSLCCCVALLGQKSATRQEVKVTIDPDLDLTPAEVASEQHYHQPLRPQFHYTPIQGHIGDVTGLIYYSGEYHLFNMYDQWSRARLAHKQWGHAISPDLIHWQQMPALLDTILDNHPGSGSGTVDWNNSSGLRVGPEKTLLVFYTDYKLGTCIAFSRDAGRTWTRYGKNPVIAGAEDARDPTVFWYPPASEWRMVRYENKGFAFYQSTNLIEWTRLSRADGYYECPDIVQLPVENAPGEKRWVLIDGNGQYTIGNFDGRQFVAEQPKLHVDYGHALYAGQTWKRTLEGGPPAYQMFWMRYPKTPKLTWNSQLSFPTDLKLWKFAEGILLCRQPIDEINNLRIAQKRWDPIEQKAGDSPLKFDGDLLDLIMEVGFSSDAEFGFTIHDQPITYSASTGKLRVGDREAALHLTGNRLRLRVLVDRSSTEVFADRGQVTFSNVELAYRSPGTSVFSVSQGSVRVERLESNRLESIWK